MSVQNPWAMHFQAAWHNDSANPRFPYALRVAFLAFGNHRRNGHAMFRAGEVRKALGHVDQDTGEWIVPPYPRVTEAIRQAVEFGLLDPSSGPRCLVVPSHRVQGGLGDPDQPCPLHRRREQQRREQRALRVVGS